MLPQKHFDKIEKGAIDQINPSAKPITKDSPKKVVEIKENSLDKNSKAADDEDDSEYDYYYDDDDNEDIVTVTPKTLTNKMRTYEIRGLRRNFLSIFKIGVAHSYMFSC